MGMRRWMWVLWPAFLLACALEMLVFGLFDPGDMNWHGASLDLSRQSVYSGAFFLFWLMAAISNALLLLLTRPGREVNQLEPGAPDLRGPDLSGPEFADTDFNRRGN
jgi:hypothetical protein